MCIIDTVSNDGEVTVIETKSAGNKKTFVCTDKCSTVPKRDIIAVLPTPELKQVGMDRLQYIFVADIDIKEY